MAITFAVERVYLSKFYVDILAELMKETGEGKSAIFKLALVVYRDSLRKDKEK